jgi:hypothetical protein
VSGQPRLSVENVLMESMQREWILAEARRLGPEVFNRLVNSVGAVHARSRLRYWQETLIARLPRSVGSAISGPSDFIDAFGEAELMPEPPRVVTRDDFVARPSYWYYQDRASIPEEWIAEAWEEVTDFRRNVTYEFIREASKLGTLDLVQSSLEFLNRVLPLHRMVEIYMNVRRTRRIGSPNFGRLSSTSWVSGCRRSRSNRPIRGTELPTHPSDMIFF